MRVTPAEWTLRRRTRGLDPASLTRTRTRSSGERERQAPECPGNAVGDSRTGDPPSGRGVGAPPPLDPGTEDATAGSNIAPETGNDSLSKGVTSSVPNPLIPLTLGIEGEDARVAVRVCSTVHIDPKTTSLYLVAEMMKEDGIRDTLRPHLPTLTLTDPAHLCDLWTCMSRLESAEDHHG